GNALSAKLKNRVAFLVDVAGSELFQQLEDFRRGIGIETVIEVAEDGPGSPGDFRIAPRGGFAKVRRNRLPARPKLSGGPLANLRIGIPKLCDQIRRRRRLSACRLIRQTQHAATANPHT